MGVSSKRSSTPFNSLELKGPAMEWIKDLVILVGLVAALWGLYKGVIEFRLQGAQKRAEIFLKKQAEYFGNKAFNEIRTLLESNSEALRTVSVEDKRAYLTFFEEVAILRNSKLLNDNLAFYMYGYYAAVCLQSENFWSNIRKDKAYWTVFLSFAESMRDRIAKDREVVRADIEV